MRNQSTSASTMRVSRIAIRDIEKIDTSTRHDKTDLGVYTTLKSTEQHDAKTFSIFYIVGIVVSR